MIILKTSMLLFMLLNPFLLIIYLIDFVKKASAKQFLLVLIRASLISFFVFSAFALMGDYIFKEIIQADFASFQIFGGIIFLLIGIQFVFQGNLAIGELRGENENIAGAIAMPIMIGPGTISACIIIGKKLDTMSAILSIFTVLLVSLICMYLLKRLHDIVKTRREILIQRYVEVMGRITALFVGTISVDMIMKGLKTYFSF